MKVLFLPQNNSNPYQNQLIKALKKWNVYVTASNGKGRFPILGALSIYGKPDVLHMHWTNTFIISNTYFISFICAFRFIIEILFAKMMRIKIVWTVHNIVNHEKRYSHLEILCNKFLSLICNRIIVHSKHAFEEFMKIYGLSGNIKDKINIIPHGHYINSYENIIGREESRQVLGLDGKSIVFLFLGSIRPYKGIHKLIEAFENLESSQVRLLIAGNLQTETIRDNLVARCQLDKRIRLFPQFVPDKNVQLYMNAADLVVLPYKDILTSGSILLAMSFGKSIIAPRLGCISELLDASGAFLYDPQKNDGLKEALETSLTANLVEMGNYNYYKAKNFDWDEIAHKTHMVYRKC